MEPEFWHDKWKRRETGFHNVDVHPMLAAHIKDMSWRAGQRIFLPLCGKTLDIGWLMARGFKVAGAELSQSAVEDLFRELGTAPKITPLDKAENKMRGGEMLRYSADNIDVFVGNIFALTQDALKPVDGIYDRAALVALPPEMRDRYAGHLVGITQAAPQLLISFEYNQTQMDGPPFSVTGAEIGALYNHTYSLTPLDAETVPGGLKGKCEALETVWKLS